MKIDKIYVINLEHRKDRKKEIMEELSNMKVDDLGKVEIFRGIGRVGTGVEFSSNTRSDTP